MAVLLFMTMSLWAQDNATVNGSVTDPTGAVVANAQISLTNPATGQVRAAVSNNAGAYRFPNVGVGKYTLTATAPGFEKYSKTDIVVNVAQTLEENIALHVGSQAQTVTVAADELQVQTETSEVSTLISGQQVEQLSTNGRNVTALAALGLGVSNNLSQFSGVDALTSANGISFNGTRTEHNIYLLDGAEQNDRGCGGCFMNLPSQDAISEFQTLESNYSSDYGIGSGGTIVMVLKSGTHDFHGEVYEFNRNTDYDANDYFTKAAGQPRPAFHLNEPGGNIGGPIFIPGHYNANRNRTFFFWNEEWRRLIQGSSPSVVNTIMASNFPASNAALDYTVPSGAAVPTVPCNGTYPNCQLDPAKAALYALDGLTPGQPFNKNANGTYTIPANLIDQNAVLLLNAGTFPKPNVGTSQFISSIPTVDNIREEAARIDHSINSKFQLMGHYLHDAMAKSFYPPLWGDSTYPTVGTAMTNPSYTAVIKLTQTYSPNLLNETGYFYSGNKITLTPQSQPGYSFNYPSGWEKNSSGNPAGSFFPATDNDMSRLPAIFLQGTPLNVTWDPSYFPWKNGYEGFEPRDDVSWTRGRHQFKFGFSWLHDYKNQQLQYNTNGNAYFNSSAFSGDSYVNFLLGEASSFSQLQFLAGKHWVNNNYGFYALDNWHVSPRLTLNLGLRYDGMPHAFERYNLFANFVPADYSYSQGDPVNQATGTLNPASLTTFNEQPFYLNGIQEAGVNGFPRGNVQNYYKTWQPRLGFAYALPGNVKTVLRGGFGMFYERVQGNDVYNAALNPPFAYIPSANNVYFTNPNTSALSGATTSQIFPASMTTISYHYPSPGTANYSLGVQHEVTQSVVAVVQYVGSAGWSQSDDRHINTLPLETNGSFATREGVASGTLNANFYRIYPGFADIAQEENETNFNYNSLQAGIRIENRYGLTTQVAYTWSHLIDLGANDLYALSDPFNPRYDRGSDNTFDRRNDLNISFVYALPFAKHGTTLARTTIGGWSLSGIVVAESGVPQTVLYTGTTDTLGLGGDGATTNRPNLVAKVTYPKTVGAWFSANSFADPVAPWKGGSNQGFGDAGKDAVVGPGIHNLNLSLFKSIPIKENGPKFELRFESFNTLNHTIFQSVDVNNHDSNFGAVTNDYGPRLLELGGKFVF